jgi:hypothetical protein
MGGRVGGLKFGALAWLAAERTLGVVGRPRTASWVGLLAAGWLLVSGCGADATDPSPTQPLAAKEPLASRAPAVREAVPVQPGPASRSGEPSREPQTGEPDLSLDQLFDIGDAEAPNEGLDLRALSDAGALDAPPPPRNAADVIRERARYRHESGKVGPEGTSDQRVGVAEAGVAVPVDDDESVHIRGGVRVDYETDEGSMVDAPEPAPTVGVEVRF